MNTAAAKLQAGGTIMSNNRFFVKANSQILRMVLISSLLVSMNTTAYAGRPKIGLVLGGGGEGLLIAHGGIDSGYALYIKDGKLTYVHNYVAKERYYVRSEKEISAGRHKLSFEFTTTGKPDIKNGKGTPGIGKLFIDGKPAGKADIPVTTPIAIGLTSDIVCGESAGSPISPEYKPPFKFTGKIYGVTIDVSGEHIGDPETEAKTILARQ